VVTGLKWYSGATLRRLRRLSLLLLPSGNFAIELLGRFDTFSP
jgi:hypothetical protein